jgi:hypothetical protein
MTAITTTTHATAMLPLDQLTISPFNVRKHSKKEALRGFWWAKEVA